MNKNKIIPVDKSIPVKAEEMNISQKIKKAITAKHKKVSDMETPKHFVKKKMGMDYVEIGYMKHVAEAEYPGWSWKIVSTEVLGSEGYVVHGRLKWHDEGIWRKCDMVASHRIQKKRGTGEFVDIGNDVKAANTDCLKKAFNMYMNIADDVYKNQVEDLELSDEKKDSILEIAGQCSKMRLEEIKKLIDNQTIHNANFNASYAKLQREVESKNG